MWKERHGDVGYAVEQMDAVLKWQSTGRRGRVRLRLPNCRAERAKRHRLVSSLKKNWSRCCTNHEKGDQTIVKIDSMLQEDMIRNESLLAEERGAYGVCWRVMREVGIARDVVQRVFWLLENACLDRIGSLGASVLLLMCYLPTLDERGRAACHVSFFLVSFLSFLYMK